MNGPTSPSLTELIDKPERARELPSHAAADLLTKVIGLQTALLAQILLTDRSSGSSQESAGEERLLTVEEAARKLGASEDWLYRHSKQLPFTVRNGRQLRFSECGIDRWIRTHQGRS